MSSELYGRFFVPLETINLSLFRFQAVVPLAISTLFPAQVDVASIRVGNIVFATVW
jgi:hypothetical protein